MFFEILRIAHARKMLAVSHGTFYNWRRRGLTPQAVKISSKCVGYPADEVEAVARARVAGWSDEQIAELVIQLAAARPEKAARCAAAFPFDAGVSHLQGRQLNGDFGSTQAAHAALLSAVVSAAPADQG